MLYGLQEAKGRIAKGKCARANEQQFAILLLWAGLVVVRELGFLGQRYLCSVCLVVEGQGLVGILEIVKGLILFPILFCNPVQELCAILLVLRVVSLILFKSKIMPFLFIQRGLATVTRQGFCEIVAADESGRVENGPANHDSDRRHCVYIQGLHIGWEYFLVLQVFLQRDAARHDGCELNVVHRAGAGVASKVFFDDFLSNPANTSDKACDSCGVEERFDELVVRHGGVYIGVLRFVPAIVFVFVLCLSSRHPLLQPLPPPLLLQPLPLMQLLPVYIC